MAAPGVLLGIDVGSTSIKAAVVDLHGRELSTARVHTPWDEVPSGAEVDPRALRDAAFSASRRALALLAGHRVLGVGVAGMAEAVVLLDGHGDPVAPAIAWFDLRGDDEAKQLGVELGEDAFARQTGIPLSRLCTLAKLRWLQRHRIGTDRAVRCLGVAEWVAASLGGGHAAERSAACRSGFLDLWTAQWWDAALDATGFDAGFLPDPVTAGTPIGRASDALPVVAGATLTVAGLDHCAAAIGAGAVGPADAFTSCGTAEAVIRRVATGRLTEDVVASAVNDGVQVGYHAVGGHALVCGFPAGRALLRVLAVLGTDDGERAALDDAALAVPAGADGVRLADVIGDHATLTGLRWGLTPGHVWRAALEAVADESRKLIARADAVAGPHRRLVATGGWWRSRAYATVRQAMVGPVEVPDVKEAGARGAALLAGVAAGVLDVDAFTEPAAPADDDRGVPARALGGTTWPSHADL